MATSVLNTLEEREDVSGRVDRTIYPSHLQTIVMKAIMTPLLWIASICFSCWNPLFSQKLQITELCASNENVIADPDFGKYADWIEIHNPTNEPIDLSIFYLTDNHNEPLKWKFPLNSFLQPGGHLLIFADDKNTGFHTNFKLSKKGEFVGLYAADSSVVDSFSYPMQISDVSYGRQPDKPGTLQFFEIPTPSRTNSTKGFSGVLKEPEFSHESGIYQKPFYLKINRKPGDTILFSDDGSPVSETFHPFEDSLLISGTTVIKAFSVKNNFIPSAMQTATFIVRDDPHSLPVVSVSTEPANLFSDTAGIYVVGTNGSTGYCDNIRKRNYCQDWERPAHLEYFDESGIRQMAMPVGIKIHGNCSRNASQKSLAIFARKKYGKGKIKYPLFKHKPHIEEFEAVILRNAGNDNNRSLIRDGLTAHLVRSMDLEWQGYQPVVVYLNGMYWGIMNLREKLNEHYLASNHRIDAATVDYLEEEAKVRYGSNQAFLEFLEFLKTANMKDEYVYKQVESQMDIPAYINYMATQIYAGNTDWPRTNWRHWRQHTPEGKWRWVLYDTDFGFGLIPNSLHHNTLIYATQTIKPDNSLKPSGAFIFNKLLESETFRKQFLKTFLFHLDYTFHPDTVLPVVESLAQNIEKEITHHAQRWRMTEESWINEIETIKEFASKRYRIVLGHLEQFFENELAHDVVITCTDNTKGTAHYSRRW